jgi:hypothetical protein
MTADHIEVREEGLPAPTPEKAAPGAPSPLKNPQFRNLMAVSITVALGFGMLIPRG